MDVFRDGLNRGLAFSWALGMGCVFSYYVFEALLAVGVQATYARPTALVVAGADFCLRARRNPANLLLLVYLGMALRRRLTMSSPMTGVSLAFFVLWLSFIGALVYSIVSSLVGEIVGAMLELADFVQRWWRAEVPGGREDHTHANT